jgi:hypothetical protein
MALGMARILRRPQPRRLFFARIRSHEPFVKRDQVLCQNCAVPIVCESQDERRSRRALVQNADAFLEMPLLKCGSSRLPVHVNVPDQRSPARLVVRGAASTMSAVSSEAQDCFLVVRLQFSLPTIRERASSPSGVLRNRSQSRTSTQFAGEIPGGSSGVFFGPLRSGSPSPYRSPRMLLTVWRRTCHYKIGNTRRYSSRSWIQSLRLKLTRSLGSRKTAGRIGRIASSQACWMS